MGRWAAILSIVAIVATTGQALAQSRGIDGREAPSWRVEKWFNLPDGADSIDVDDYKGKVVYLYGFQSWCPGCHSHGFPTLQELIKRFDDAEDVAFVAVQTTFEGFHTNTAANALQTARRYDLDVPVGHSGTGGNRSRLMRDYRTGGTPWTIIIDRNGIVRFDDFRISADRAERLINRLRHEPVERDQDNDSEDSATDESPPPDDSPDDAPEDAIETLPDSRGGQDLVGSRLPAIEFDRWVFRGRGEPKEPTAAADSGEAQAEDDAPSNQDAEAGPKATLYRWWTDTCPYCEASLPAIEQLRKKYEDDGLRVVAVYHPKPPRKVDDEAIAAAAEQRDFNGPVALDRDWSVLNRFYLSTGDRRATSASFLVDGDGVIRFVHPGPVFFPSDEPRFERENDDFELLHAAVRQLLAESE